MVGDTSLFVKSSHRKFYRALVDEFDPSTELRFAVMELDGRPVAFHFGFEVNRTFVWYKPAFDVNLWQDSPGEVLLKRLFESVAQRDVDTFDFTIGDEAFKSRFANRIDRVYTLYLFPPRLMGHARHFVLAKK